MDFSTVWSAVNTCLSAVLTLLAALPIAYAVQGFSYKKLGIPIRLLCLAMGCCLIVPNLFIELPATAVVLAIYYFHRKEYYGKQKQAAKA